MALAIFASALTIGVLGFFVFLGWMHKREITAKELRTTRRRLERAEDLIDKLYGLAWQDRDVEPFATRVIDEIRTHQKEIATR